jgi:hypothetical protein
MNVYGAVALGLGVLAAVTLFLLPGQMTWLAIVPALFAVVLGAKGDGWEAKVGLAVGVGVVLLMAAWASRLLS